MWIILSSVVVAVFIVAAVAFSLRAARTARTPQGAVGWVVFLMSAPHLAVPLYLFLGNHRFRGYVTARRESEQVIAGIRSQAMTYSPPPGATPIDLGPFEYCAGLPALRGNSGRILVNGATAFDAMFDAIDAARHYLLVQFYIIRDDELGRALADRLIAAAGRGVNVRMIMDPVGSFRLSRSYAQRLYDAGIRLVEGDTSPLPTIRFRLNFRNHRKTVIADGEIGFTGGLNVGDEYMGRDPNFGDWRDTMVELRGPMVSQLQLIFAEDWHYGTGETLLESLNWNPPHADADATGLIVATGPADQTETGNLMFFSAINAAKDRCWIASPYFVPDTDILSALRNAALRGVDVRLLVPDVIDHKMPWLAAFSYFDDIREAGARVFRYTRGFMHQKVILIDDTIGAVGTANLDNRSFRLNFEAMAMFFDASVARDVAAMLEADFDCAYELDRTLMQQPAHIRWTAPLARLFSPLL